MGIDPQRAEGQARAGGKAILVVFFFGVMAIFFVVIAMVVLAIGMEPEANGLALPDDVVCDSSGFIEGSADGGQIGAGSSASPLDVNRSVQSATGDQGDPPDRGSGELR